MKKKAIGDWKDKIGWPLIAQEEWKRKCRKPRLKKYNRDWENS